MGKKVLRRSHPVARAAASESASGPLCVVYSANSPVEAHLVRGLLEDSGVRCFLSNEFIATVDSPLSGTTGGVKVQVRESDRARAGEILREQSLPDGTPPLA